ncbi:FtsB family cell division protein [Thiomicrorhabdus arctica]|uniref:FtsB family cell division protein n=1 Tax=Thiomicrorhabdus arctica TaxID=131540 RepID=UPI0003638B73|nr:septum formation initiator family protein [Thiomicrorhabdus arctica]
MKKIYLGLAFLILIIQARLLSSEGGVGELFALHEQLKTLEISLEEQRLVNAQLGQQVKDLQSDTASVETIARQTLGMVKKGEVFINVIELDSAKGG